GGVCAMTAGDASKKRDGEQPAHKAPRTPPGGWGENAPVPDPYDDGNPKVVEKDSEKPVSISGPAEGSPTTGDAAAGASISQAEFWQAGRDRYVVEPAYRDGSGKLHNPDEQHPANRWVILRERWTIESELPAVCPVGVFEDGEIARRIRDLI